MHFTCVFSILTLTHSTAKWLRDKAICQFYYSVRALSSRQNLGRVSIPRIFPARPNRPCPVDLPSVLITSTLLVMSIFLIKCLVHCKWLWRQCLRQCCLVWAFVELITSSEQDMSSLPTQFYLRLGVFFSPLLSVYDHSFVMFTSTLSRSNGNIFAECVN